MKLPTVYLIGGVLLFVVILLSIYWNIENRKNIEPIKVELQNFINIELINCPVTQIFESKFSGMGYYKKIKTVCSNLYFPLLPKYEDVLILEEYIEIGSVVSKDSNSTEIYVENLGDTKVFYLRIPSTLDDDSGIYYIWIFLLFLMSIFYYLYKKFD